MAELKVYRDTDDYISFEDDVLEEAYDKSEADKVIAELERNLSEIQSQKMQLEDDVALLRRNNAELKDKLKVQTSSAEEAWKLKDSYHASYAEAVKELYDKNKEIAELKKQVHDYAQGLY